MPMVRVSNGGTDGLIPDGKLIILGFGTMSSSNMFFDIPKSSSSAITLNNYRQVVVPCKNITTLHWQCDYSVLHPYGYIKDGDVTSVGDLRQSTTISIDKSYSYLTICDITGNYAATFWFD